MFHDLLLVLLAWHAHRPAWPVDWWRLPAPLVPRWPVHLPVGGHVPTTCINNVCAD